MPFDGNPEKFAPAEVDEVGQIILKARELLSDPERWCKGTLRDVSGAYCVLGAMLVSGDLTDEGRERLEAALPTGQFCVVTFNNDPATTHADVLALLDRAAKGA